MDKPLWAPTQPTQTQLYAFQQWIEKKEHQTFKNVHAFHHWSIQHFPLFWKYVTDFFHVPFRTPYTQVFQKIGTELWQNEWFKDAKMNIVDLMLDHDPNRIALVSLNEQNLRQTLTYGALKQAVYACAQGLIDTGVVEGDRVAGMMPNGAETIIAMLACASIGAIWSACSPDFGPHAAIDRFGQIEPKVLFLTNGQYYNGKAFSTASKLTWFQSQLPSVTKTVIFPYINEPLPHPLPEHVVTWTDFLKPNPAFEPVALPFSHPLYILFSSGTTGKPKCIVHGAGNVLLQHLKELGLHCNLSSDDNLCFFTTCGWMMWNWMVSGLALGMRLTLYDGSPLYPTLDYLWDMIEREQITAFGTSARYLATIEKEGFHPNTQHAFPTLKLILTTGSPLLPTQFDFVYKHIKTEVQLSSISGGTDIVSCFVLGNPLLPVYRGEIQCAGLGMDVQVYNEEGVSVKNQKGELVCTNPFPSMPLGFWHDLDNTQYRHTYFTRFPNTWTHGDYAEQTDKHTFIIYGRSDTTLKPGGVRIGSAEIYREIEQIPEILDSVVVGQSWDHDIRVLLFVKLREAGTLTEALQNKIKQVLKTNASPRHVPDLILEVKDIPKTFNGKTVEQAIRQTVEGEKVQNLSSIANPEALAYFKLQ